MNDKTFYVIDDEKTIVDKSGCAFLGNPWASGEVCSLCAGVTGVAARLLCAVTGTDTAQAEPCLGMALTFLNSMKPGSAVPYRYRCPRGIQCVCIPLKRKSVSGRRACIWVRACRQPACGNCAFAFDYGEGR